LFYIPIGTVISPSIPIKEGRIMESYDLMTTAGTSLILVLAAAIYLAPCIISDKRNHPARTAILLVNIFLGWTLIIWLVCLIWAYSGKEDNNDNNRTNRGLIILSVIAVLVTSLLMFTAIKSNKTNTLISEHLNNIDLEVYYRSGITTIALTESGIPSYGDATFFGMDHCKTKNPCVVWFFDDEENAYQGEKLLKQANKDQPITGLIAIFSRNKKNNNIICYETKGTC